MNIGAWVFASVAKSDLKTSWEMMGDDKRGQKNNFLFSIEIWLYVVNGFKQSTV